MKHIGLFEGIGGFSLAARWMNWETIAWCEWNEFCQKILSYHFPKAIQHGDITQTDFNVYRGQCDILTGGFPCQPYSVAGKRKGTADDRHLWPEMLRAIREIQPRWVVGENVRGLVSWSNGMVFNKVQADLENEGYEVFPVLLPACGLGADHRRERVWFVAHSYGLGCERITEEPLERTQRHSFQFMRAIENVLRRWPIPESRIFPGINGLSERLDSITLSKTGFRTKSLIGAGNAIVPQAAFEIYKTIEQYELTPPTS